MKKVQFLPIPVKANSQAPQQLLDSIDQESIIETLRRYNELTKQDELSALRQHDLMASRNMQNKKHYSHLLKPNQPDLTHDYNEKPMLVRNPILLPKAQDRYSSEIASTIPKIVISNEQQRELPKVVNAKSNRSQSMESLRIPNSTLVYPKPSLQEDLQRNSHPGMIYAKKTIDEEDYRFEPRDIVIYPSEPGIGYTTMMFKRFIRDFKPCKGVKIEIKDRRCDEILDGSKLVSTQDLENQLQQATKQMSKEQYDKILRNRRQTFVDTVRQSYERYVNPGKRSKSTVQSVLITTVKDNISIDEGSEATISRREDCFPSTFRSSKGDTIRNRAHFSQEDENRAIQTQKGDKGIEKEEIPYEERFVDVSKALENGTFIEINDNKAKDSSMVMVSNKFELLDYLLDSPAKVALDYLKEKSSNSKNNKRTFLSPFKNLLQNDIIGESHYGAPYNNTFENYQKNKNVYDGTQNSEIRRMKNMRSYSTSKFNPRMRESSEIVSQYKEYMRRQNHITEERNTQFSEKRSINPTRERKTMRYSSVERIR